MKVQSENCKKNLYELEVYLKNVNKSLFKIWKKSPMENGRKIQLGIGKSPITKWK